MKSLVFASALALSLLGFATPPPAATRDSGPSANGSFQFSADGLAKRVEFNARTHQDGTTTGQMTFSGPAEVPDQDVDGEGGAPAGGQLADVFTKVEFDCLVVEGNRAVMSGVITESTIGEHIGQRALLEWVATDAEREDDAGVPSRRSEVVGCQSFPLSSYSFVDVKHGDGNIQVRP